MAGKTRTARAARRSGPHRSSYWVAARQPLHILVFVLPLIIAFELALALFLQTRQTVHTVLAHSYLLRFFDAFDIAPQAGLHLGGVAIILVLLLWHVLNRDSWRVKWSVVGMMAAESFLLIVPLLVLGRVLPRETPALATQHAAATGAPWSDAASPSGQTTAPVNGDGLWVVAQTAAPPTPPGAEAPESLDLLSWLAISIGAGLYEELVFRMLLIAIIHTLLVDVGKASNAVGATVAIIVSAAAFTAYHPLEGSARKLAFYFLAGLYFGAVYVLRGFGIVVGVHAMYDIVTVSLASLADQ